MAAKKAGKKKRTVSEAAPDVGDPIRVSWRLAELPSSQHKTGLVGLVLMLRWLDRKPKAKRRGVLRIAVLDARALTIEVDREGLSWLFDEVYAAEEIESEYGKPFKDLEPVRVVQRQEQNKKKIDKKTGEPVTRVVTKYVYPVVRPTGAFLAEADPGGPEGAWIKLWRDTMWSVLRPRDKQRLPYHARARDLSPSDAGAAWRVLSAADGHAIELASTYFVGALSVTEDNVSFRDRERLQFLLHFWPFACGLSVPVVLDREGKSDFVGHVIAFPDVLDLQTFCDEYSEVLARRSPELAAYLPKQALLDLPAEAGLLFLSALRDRLTVSEGKKLTRDLVLGVDVFHLKRDGNNVRLLFTTRVEPSEVLEDEYERIRTHFRDPLFRRQLLANLLTGSPWHAGFERLFSTIPSAHFLRAPRREGTWPSQFPFDAQRQFKDLTNEVNDE